MNFLFVVEIRLKLWGLSKLSPNVSFFIPTRLVKAGVFMLSISHSGDYSMAIAAHLGAGVLPIQDQSRFVSEEPGDTKATEISATVQGLINQISFAEEVPWWQRRQNPGRSRRGTFAIRADERLNALTVTGEGDKFEVVESLISVLDVPAGSGEQRIVKLYPLLHADVDVVAAVLTEAFGSTNRRWWQEPDPTVAATSSTPPNSVPTDSTQLRPG